MCSYEGVKCEKNYSFETFALLDVARQTLVVDYRRFGTTSVPGSGLKQFAHNSPWTASASKKGPMCCPATYVTIYEHS